MDKSFSGVFSAMTRRLGEETAPVWAVHDEALKRAANGEDIYLLSVGDPDLATLPSTIGATIDSLQKGRTHYAPGRGELRLRQTIADVELRASGRPCDPDEIVIFPGATNAIYSVLACLLDPGDDIIVLDPMYVGYEGIFRALDLNKVGVALDVENNFAFDIDAIKNAVTATTKLVFVNTPGNPAGNIISGPDLEALAHYCRERNIWLVCDEVYSMLTFEEKHVSLRKAASELDNVIIIDGLSKSHAMSGWRLGWVVASRSVTDHLLDFTSSVIFGCCQFVQDAAAFALTNDEEYINGVREEYCQRRNYVCERVANISGISCGVPKAGMFVMINVAALDIDGLQFAQQLLDEQGVSVLPGVGFGECTAGYVRVSLAQPINILRPAFDRIELFLAQGIKPTNPR
jgi:arginine:pyruvate transaminase|tara:strand:+ start:1477 stop:2685 length:1209 start_codon:yes stop_codon:yes gene_type:complete